MILGIVSSSIAKITGGSPVTVTDADAQLFVNAAVISDSTQGNAVDNFVIALKGYSIWTKLKVLNVKVGGTSLKHKWNLKDPRDLDVAFRYTYTGTWVHSASGAKPNGTNAFANTYCNLNTLGLSGNFSFGYYLTVANTLLGDRHGLATYSSGNNWTGIQHNSATDILGMAYSNAGMSLTISGANNGFFAMSVNGTTKKIYHKGLSASGTTNGTNVSTLNFYEGSLNYNGSYYNGLNGCYGTSFIGQGLTDTEIANLQTAIITFETALGRNV